MMPYDVSLDGQRFLMIKANPASEPLAEWVPHSRIDPGIGLDLLEAQRDTL